MIAETHPDTSSSRDDNCLTAASCCDPRSLFGWSPPDLPADIPLKRGVDRFMPRRGLPVVIYFAAVVALVNLQSHLPTRAGLTAAAIGSLAGSAWCGANFWRCRHAHCVVTSAGWLAVAAIAMSGAILGHSVTGGNEGLAFVAVVAAALIFEAIWYSVRHTNAVSGGHHRID